MNPNDLIGMGGVPVVVALVAAFRVAFAVEARWLPVASVAAGVLWNVGAAYVLHTDLGTAVLYGVLTGLTASGLYSGGKALVGR